MGDDNAIVPSLGGAGALIPQNMREAMELARFMSRAKTLPKHLWDSEGDCLMIIEQSMRWRMSPFAVAQKTSSIAGKLMYEGQLVAAAVESMGAIKGHWEYEYGGTGAERWIKVRATRPNESEPREVTVSLKDARTTNAQWDKQPDQMLAYHGTRVWARRWTPAALMGVYSPEEFDRAEVKPPLAELPVTTDVPLDPVVADEPTAPEPETKPETKPPAYSARAQWSAIKKFAQEAEDATTQDEAEALLDRFQPLINSGRINIPDAVDAYREAHDRLIDRLWGEVPE